MSLESSAIEFFWVLYPLLSQLPLLHKGKSLTNDPVIVHGVKGEEFHKKRNEVTKAETWVKKNTCEETLCLLNSNNYKSESHGNISQHSSITRNTGKQSSVAIHNERLENIIMYYWKFQTETISWQLEACFIWGKTWMTKHAPYIWSI